MPIPLLAPLAIAGVETIISEVRRRKAEKALKNMGPRPNYSVSPELRSLYDRAQQLSTGGFTPQEKAGFRNNVAQDINTQSQKALDMSGGNLSRVISRMGKINEMNAENKFAAQDAQLMRNNIHYADSIGHQIQSQKNLATGSDIQDYRGQQQAYGQAAGQQMGNVFNALNQAAYYAYAGGKNPTGGVSIGGNGFGGNSSMNLNKIPSTDSFINTSNPYGLQQAMDFNSYT